MYRNDNNNACKLCFKSKSQRANVALALICNSASTSNPCCIWLRRLPAKPAVSRTPVDLEGGRCSRQRSKCCLIWVLTLLTYRACNLCVAARQLHPRNTLLDPMISWSCGPSAKEPVKTPLLPGERFQVWRHSSYRWSGSSFAFHSIDM